MADPKLKQALKNGEFIVAPGVFDLISALIADTIDFKALYVTGYGTVASYLGLPDAGIATYRDMVERIGQIVKRTTRPVAVDSRRSDDFLIIARTDARTGLGLDEAIRRGQAFAKAGADVVFVESPETVEEMQAITQAIDAPLFANIVNGGRTPLLRADALKKMGYSIAIHPAIGFLSAGFALRQAYADLHAHGETSADIDLYSFAEFNQLLGFQDVWDFEKKFAQDR
jgi:2-methylisocitrate lyase-like PEP mutase family enzyme